jgi:transglutaminase/protease-like cytokinesis protein 3
MVSCLGITSEAKFVSLKPEKYARDPHGCYTINISPSIRKKGDKVHNAIKKSKQKCYWLKGKTTKEIDAVLAYMSAKYLPYQVEDEFPLDSHTYRGVPGKYEMRLSPKLYQKLRKKDRYVRDEVLKAIKQMQIHSMTSEEDAIVKVNDWICKRVDYDWKGYNDEEADLMYSAYQGLKKGVVVCEGYADLFQIFMNELGIRGYRISSFDHIWNNVVLGDGKDTVQVDVCWNDSGRGNLWLMKVLFPDHDMQDGIYDNRYVVLNKKIKRVFYDKKRGY